MYDSQLDVAFIEDKLINVKDQSRQNNIRIDGFKEKQNETQENCEKKLDKPFKASLDPMKEVLKGHTKWG